MPTTLTTPIVKSVTKATVDNWKLDIRRNADLTINGDTQFTATIGFRLADGTVEYQTDLVIKTSAMSAGAQTSLRNFHNSIVTYLRSLGMLPAGVDTQDV